MDEKRFQQALLNYQSNAIKFSNKKEGKVRVLLQYVRRLDESDDEKVPLLES